MSEGYQKFGKFMLLERLAAGGMAEIYLARALGAADVGKFVAIKRILPEYSDTKEYIEMFKDEAKIAVNLSHKNIVNIYEFGMEAEQFYLVMDYFEGRNLKQIMKNMNIESRKFSIAQIVFVIKEIASGLDHSHSCLEKSTGELLNIVHRDISPQNIMIGFSGEVKIIDFGIAKAETQDEKTTVGVLKGKFGYMSPEQVELKDVDSRTDIFSMGILLWELLANKRLFGARTQVESIRKVSDCIIPSLIAENDQVDPDLERICLKALARLPENRYQKASDLFKELNQFLNVHYPEFSYHEVSDLIQDVYKVEIIGSRHRLINYSKLEGTEVDFSEESTMRSYLDGLSPEEKKEAEQRLDHKSRLEIPRHEVIRVDVPGSQTGRYDVNSDPFGLKAPPKPQHLMNKSEEKGKVKAYVAKKKLVSAGELLPKDSESLIKKKIRLEEENVSFEEDGSGKGTLNTVKSNLFRSKIEASIFILIGAVVITYTLGIFFPKEMEQVNLRTVGVMKQVGVYDLFNRVGLIDKKESLNKVAGKSAKEVEKRGVASKGKGEQSAKGTKNGPAVVERVNVLISSKPPGADIYINGQNTGEKTPKKFRVSKTSDISVDLRLRDYKVYRSGVFKVSTIKDEMIKIKMTPHILDAFINVDVKPRDSSDVYIDGYLISDMKLPLKKYPVPSGIVITVTAKNKFTDNQVTKRIKLRKTEHKSIVFELEK